MELIKGKYLSTMIRNERQKQGLSLVAEGEDWYDIAYFLEEFADYIRDYN